MASASEDELADLPGADLVALLANTYRRADFDVVARILHARDLRDAKIEAELRAALADLAAATARGCGDAEVTAELQAALTEMEAVRDKSKALLDVFDPPQDEVEEMAPMAGDAAAPEPPHQEEPRVEEEAKEAEVKGGIDVIDLSSDEEEEEDRAAGGCDEEEERAAGGCDEEEEEEDEEDTESLSQRVKRLRRIGPGELESGKGDVRGPSKHVAALGNEQHKSSSVWVDVLVPTPGNKMVSKPEDSKAEAFVHKATPVVKTEKLDGERSKTMLPPSQGLLGRGTIQEGSSKSDYCKAGIGDKERSSDGVPARGVSQPSKRIANINKTPMVDSSAKCENKEVGAEKCASLPRLSEEPRITRDVVPFQPGSEKNTSVQVKRETNLLPSIVTSKWESEADVFISSFNDDNGDFNIHALCALHRQGKLAIGDKRNEYRANKLVEFLLDGDLHGPVKRTAQELKNQDDAAFLRQVTIAFSGQLYDIFKSKEDPYFC